MSRGYHGSTNVVDRTPTGLLQCNGQGSWDAGFWHVQTLQVPKVQLSSALMFGVRFVSKRGVHDLNAAESNALLSLFAQVVIQTEYRNVSGRPA